MDVARSKKSPQLADHTTVKYNVQTRRLRVSPILLLRRLLSLNVIFDGESDAVTLALLSHAMLAARRATIAARNATTTIFT